jgi:hypothetical protein
MAFADAMVGTDDQTLATARAALVAAMGAAAMVDAAGVVSNFERMVRIADGTGIPLDAPMARASEDIRAMLDLQSLSNRKRNFE